MEAPVRHRPYTATVTVSPWIAAPILSIILCSVFAALTWQRNVEFIHDDSYITLRYVRNFLDGVGLVWNPGERVQGYTSFLQAGILVLFGAAGMDLERATRVLGVTSYVLLLVSLTLAQVHRWRQGSFHPLDALPIVLAAGSAPILVWACGGLDGPTFAFLAMSGALCFLAALRTPQPAAALSLSGTFFALTMLTRPDGAAFALATILATLLLTDDRVRNLRRFLIPIAIILIPYMCWSYWYYRDIVPNTYYAKASDHSWKRITDGLWYVWAFASKPPFVFAAFPFALLVGLWRRDLRRPLAYLFLLVGSYVAVIVLVGGDHMTAYRFFIPIVPMAAYGLYLGLSALLPARATLRCALVYLVSTGLILLQLSVTELNPVSMDLAAQIGGAMGKYINKYWPAGSLVALNTAGSTPYFAPKLRFIDMLGLNDRHIARRRVDAPRALMQATMPGHWKGDGKYVLSREPDYIIVGGAAGTPIQLPWFLSDIEMLEDPRFKQRYDYFDQKLAIYELGHEATAFRFYRRNATPGDPEAKALAERANQ